MMGTRAFVAAAVATLFAACAPAPPLQIVIITATFPPASPTDTPQPTKTPSPTIKPSPTPVPFPTEGPIPIIEFERLLHDSGYKRFPFTDDDGQAGYHWIKDNAYEQITTWEDGTVRLEVLDDKSAAVRSEHMDRKFRVLDLIFSDAFMTELRRKNEAYNRTVGPSVSGKPDTMYPPPPGDIWAPVLGEYNASDTKIGNVPVRFSLWWWQVSCPPRAQYCYFIDFPGVEFVGDASLVFYSIQIVLPSGGGPSSPSA
jgi:hypothetical protein